MKLTLQTIETAPDKSRPLLEGALKSLGFVPNLFASLANSPAVLEGYINLNSAFGQTSFSPTEQEIIALTASVENECHYCVAAHSTIGQMRKVAPEVVQALRAGKALTDAKQDALRQFTKAAVTQRGVVEASVQEAFLAAGYTPAQALEVLLGVAVMTLSNYANHLTATPIDSAFASNAWSPEPAACGCACAH